MKRINIKKSSLFYIATLPLVWLLVIFIANRSDQLPDYVMYLGIFNNINYRVGIEYSYIIIVKLIHYFNGDIIDVMYVYSFLGLYLKSRVVFSKTSLDGDVTYYYLFMVGYLLSFLLVWEYIQIRAAAGVSLFLIGVYSRNNKAKFFVFIFSCLFHYSMALPTALYICFSIVKSIKYRLILIPFVVIIAMVFFYFTPYSTSYSANNYMISGKGILSTQYCLVYLNILICAFFYKAIRICREETIKVLFGSIVITIMMVVFNKSFPALTDRLMDIATFVSFVPLFFIRNKGYKYFLVVYVIFFGLMRLRVVSSGLDPHVMNLSSFFSL